MILIALLFVAGCPQPDTVVEVRHQDGSFDVYAVDIVRDGVRYSCRAPWKLGKVRCTPLTPEVPSR